MFCTGKRRTVDGDGVEVGGGAKSPAMVPVAAAAGGAADRSGLTASIGNAAAVTAAIFRRFTRTPSLTRITDWSLYAGLPADERCANARAGLLVPTGRRCLGALCRRPDERDPSAQRTGAYPSLKHQGHGNPLSVNALSYAVFDFDPGRICRWAVKLQSVSLFCSATSWIYRSAPISDADHLPADIY